MTHNKPGSDSMSFTCFQHCMLYGAHGGCCFVVKLWNFWHWV